MRFAGCDPGQTGACVVVDEDGETVLAVQTWEDAELPPALTILDGVVVLALEEQYIGPGARRPQARGMVDPRCSTGPAL
jgi:hypothetical protein